MEKVKEILEGVIREIFDAEITAEVGLAPELEEESERGFRADLATNVAMKLVGVLKKKNKEFVRKPREVTGELKEEFLKVIPALAPELEGVEIEVAGPGFLNFQLPDGFYREVVQKFCTDFSGAVRCEDYKGKVVVTEFSDPNPFKVLHVGHLYTSIVGESISRLIEFAGGEVHRVNFGGDVGLHVAKTIYALRRSLAPKSLSSDASRARPSLRGSRSPDLGRSLRYAAEKRRLAPLTIEDIAEAYVEGTRMYEEDEGARGEIVELNKEIYRISQEDVREGEVAELYWKGRELSYKYFVQFYDKIGVKFEKFYPESSVAERGLKEVREHTPGVYKESEGAVVFPGEKFGLHTRVFVNKEGLPTYETKDVGLLFTKFDEYKFDESVVITGNDIVDYMKVVLKSVEQYAPELAQKTRHLTHGNVRLPGNEKMSSRKGNFIRAVDVLEMAPLDAIKYSFLKYKVGGNIEFNAEESVSLTGNSGVYLQYSAVRAKKILNNDALSKGLSRRTSGVSSGRDVSLRRLSRFEIVCMRKMIEYSKVLEEAVREMTPHVICTYLFELAQSFSRFYENCRVAGSEEEEERVKIVYAFEKIMEHGLGLLGISVPEEM